MSKNSNKFHKLYNSLTFALYYTQRKKGELELYLVFNL